MTFHGISEAAFFEALRTRTGGWQEDWTGRIRCGAGYCPLTAVLLPPGDPEHFKSVWQAREVAKQRGFREEFITEVLHAADLNYPSELRGLLLDLTSRR